MTSNDDWHDDENVEALITSGETLIQRIFARENLETLQEEVEAGAPLWYQDAEGTSALHAATFVQNQDLVLYLIKKGAVWNAVDNSGNTAGDIALSYNNEEIYNIIRDAGIRSEFLLSVLSSQEESLPKTSSSGERILLRVEDPTAAGSLDAFLSSRLIYTKDARGQEICVVKAGESEVGVMMGWEREIMQETVNKMCLNHPNLKNGLQILNVGFGLGIIDTAFQALSSPPIRHVIIEAHPDVLQHMRELGWHEKPGVIVLEGTWQEVADREDFRALGQFDMIYTDTFSESYQKLYQFFKLVPNLLNGPNARFSYFNGCGATNALFYDVYTQLAGMHLEKMGFKVDWSDIDVTGENHMDEKWGETRKYFTLRYYRLPIARL